MRQRVMVRVCVAVVGAGLLAALGACGRGSSSASAPITSASPTRGGTLVVTFQADPVTLDPAVDFEGPGWAIEHCVFGNLLNYSSGPGAAGTKIVTDMATEVPTVANGGITNGGKTYIFHIRPGIKFAPPVNREVHRRRLRLQLPAHDEPAHGAGQGLLRRHRRPAGLPERQGQDHHRLQGDRQVHPRGRPEKPIATFLNIMEMPFSAPVAKEWVAKWGKQVGRHPLGTGPYVSTTGRPARTCCSCATRTTRARPATSTRSSSSSRSPRPRPCSRCRAATPTCWATTSRRPTSPA